MVYMLISDTSTYSLAIGTVKAIYIKVKNDIWLEIYLLLSLYKAPLTRLLC